MTLDHLLADRHNGITVTRTLLAALVVAGHAYSLGGHDPDPLKRAVGVTLGELGLNAFFALSGCLVALSWKRSRTTGEYLLKRCRRIFPGYWVCLILVAGGLLPLLSLAAPGAPANPDEYFSYVWSNALLKQEQTRIGGFFATQPASGVVNGSLWSLFPEFLCYAGLAIAGGLGLWTQRRWAGWALLVAAWLLPGTALWFWPDLAHGGHGRWWWVWRLATQAACFAGGVAISRLATRTGIAAKWRVLAGIGLLLSLLGGVYLWFAPLLLPYLVLTLATGLPAAVRRFEPDYSYGIYIYHFPVAQSLIALQLAAAASLVFFAQILLATLPLAALSWHLVERPALRFPARRPAAS